MAATEDHNPQIHNLEDGHGAPVYDFKDQSIRKGFIRKVYATLMSQLLVTMGVIAFFWFHKPTKEFVVRDSTMLLTYFIMGIVCVSMMACSTQLRRIAPINFIFLAIMTIAQSILLGYLTCVLQSLVVLFSIGISAAVCLAVTIYALQTKWDFTMVRGMLVAFSTVLLTFGILVLVLPDIISILAYAAGAALIFCLYLVYDIQEMVRGKHTWDTSPEEYIFAVLNLYLDIIIIILFILLSIACRLIGIRLIPSCLSDNTDQ